MCAIRNGEFDLAQTYLDEGLQIAQKIGASGPLIFGNWMAGEIAHWQGDYEGALAYGGQALEKALPLEEFMPWMVVPPLGSLGSAYLDISEQFRDKITDFHQHALRLMEMPAGTMTGGTAWADLGFCAVEIGDLELADEVFQKGLNYPTMFMYVEKARLLAGSALLALAKGETDEAYRLAGEALSFAQERDMRNMYPLTHLTMGKVQASRDEIDVALSSFDRAETEAMALNMRPFVWQSRVTAAETLKSAGRMAESEVKRTSARTVVEEISGLFKDEELRSTYLQSAMEKVGEK
jgi:tetratricopeptide (TPR) repeat protein